jgi:hypothetical protein
MVMNRDLDSITLESLGKEKTNEQKKINKQTQKQIKNPRQI